MTVESVEEHVFAEIPRCHACGQPLVKITRVRTPVEITQVMERNSSDLNDELPDLWEHGDLEVDELEDMKLTYQCYECDAELNDAETEWFESELDR